MVPSTGMLDSLGSKGNCRYSRLSVGSPGSVARLYGAKTRPDSLMVGGVSRTQMKRPGSRYVAYKAGSRRKSTWPKIARRSTTQSAETYELT